VNDNVRELLGVVAVLVLVVSLINVMSMLFLAFTGTSTSIWIFAVPSKNVGEDITCDRWSAQPHLQGVGGMYSEGSKTTPVGDGTEKELKAD
jgi:hypothetical protein